MEIKIEDYLSKEEIRDICKEEIRNCIKNDRERILNNNSYAFGTSFVESIISEEDRKFVIDKVKELLRKPSSINYMLFKEPDAWDKKRNFDINTIMLKTVEDNVSLIQDTVVKSIKNIDVDKITEYLTDNFDQVLIRLLKSVGKAE